MSLKLLFLSLALVSARDIPDPLREFYDAVTSSKSCSNKLASGFYSTDEGSHDFSYCGDHLDDFSIIYIQGKGKDTLTNMDVDCDGYYNSTTDDGRCGASTDTQGQTSFQYEVMTYGEELGVNSGEDDEDGDEGDSGGDGDGDEKGEQLLDLDANVHPYVVLGNRGNKDDFAEYDPQWDGVKPLSIVAVVCNNKLVYGIWGDYNGDDDDKSLVGEASISLATLCYGDSITGGNGHDEDDVLYIAFVGDDAVPGAHGANWTAGDAEIFEESIADLGDQLVSRITGSAAGLWSKGTGYMAGIMAVGVAVVVGLI